MIEILRKYNFWEDKNISTGYIRFTYLENIIQYLDNNLVKVLLGQRRVGKSYILRQIIHYLIYTKKINRYNIFYLNKEIHDFYTIKNSDDLYDLIKLYKKKFRIKGKVYVFLDEVQLISDWEKIVNSLSQDYIDQYEIFVTGSNSQMLSSELSTLLSGRYVTLQVYPFSYNEYIDFYALPKNKESFIKYMSKGALPELYHLQDDELCRNYIMSLKDTILFKDIVKRYAIKNSVLLEDLFYFLLDNTGNLFSVNSIVNYLKGKGIYTNVETLSQYVFYLTHSYIVHAVDRYDIQGKRKLLREKKYYINDLAFNHYLSSSYEQSFGKYLENIIYLHFSILGYTIYVGKIRNLEVDFVLEKGKDKKYVQVAYLLSDSNVIEREFGNLEKISDNYEKIVVSLDDMCLGNRNGIKHIQAWNLK